MLNFPMLQRFHHFCVCYLIKLCWFVGRISIINRKLFSIIEFVQIEKKAFWWKYHKNHKKKFQRSLCVPTRKQTEKSITFSSKPEVKSGIIILPLFLMVIFWAAHENMILWSTWRKKRILVHCYRRGKCVERYGDKATIIHEEKDTKSLTED